MADHVPPLREQEAEGQFREEAQKIVDGVVEDVRSCHVAGTRAAGAQAAAAAYRSVYARDFDLALVALKYGCPEHLKETVLKLAARAVRTAVLADLAGRPEYRAMKPKETRDGEG